MHVGENVKWAEDETCKKRVERNGLPRADKELLVYIRRIIVETADKGGSETLQFIFGIIIIFSGEKS